MKLNRYLTEAKKVTLPANIKSKINRKIINLTTPKNKTRYFNKIPLKDMFDILDSFGIVALQEDNTEWNGLLLGTEATVDFDIADKSSKDERGMYVPYTNASLRFQWYKMESGKYEITAYIG